MRELCGCRAMVAALFFIVGACAAGPNIESVKSPELTQPLSALYVAANVGAHGEASESDFRAEVFRTAQACEVRVGMEALSPVELGPEALAGRAKSFGAEHVLTVQFAGGTFNDSSWFVTFDTSLWTARLEKRLWRARIETKLEAGGAESPGAYFARILMNQLVKDRVIGTACYRNAPVYRSPSKFNPSR